MRRLRLRALAATAAVLAVALAVPAGAAPPVPTGPPPGVPPAKGALPGKAVVDVATYNIYLGADLNPLFGAMTFPDLVARAGQVYAAMEATDFPERAEAIADLIAEERPDVVGLQEVALWETAPGTIQSPTAPFTPTYDFQALLLKALADRGVSYREVATNTNFTGTLPIAESQWARFTDRDIIVVREGVPSRQLSVDESSVRERNFAAQLTIPSGVQNVPPFQVPRGWSSVDVTAGGFTFRFFNTHLEAFGPEEAPDFFRNLQAAELAGEIERSPHPAVVVGDINSRPPGCNQPNTVAFQILLDTGLREVWPAVHRRAPCGGFTSGQAADLLNPVSLLDHRIDTIFFDPDAQRPLTTEVIGDEQADRSTPSGFWPSDHAGSVAKLRTLRP